LVNAYYNTAERLGIAVTYDTEVTHVQLAANRFTHLEVTRAGKQYVVQGKALVLASGGFQSNLEWLTEAWGPAAANFLIRGTPYNRGVVLKDMLDQGALSVGDPTQCHAVAIDGRAPKFDGGIVTRLDCVPFSVVVNKHGERFYDEGEDVWPKRYAIWGRLVAAQPDQVAYVVIDAKSLNLFMPSVFPPEKADTLEALAAQLGLPVDTFMSTIDAFNAACGDTSGFHSNQLDGVCTTGLTINKTNWARPINEGPFYAYQLRPGVTFTYLGLKVDPQAKVQMQDASAENIWAAGEIMAGSILGEGYLAGFGMTIGTVYGRIAGQEAGNYVSE
jgi:tricarballylate dehydrogenase